MSGADEGMDLMRLLPLRGLLAVVVVVVVLGLLPFTTWMEELLE